MLEYNMDVEKGSLWLRTTPGAIALSQPFCCTEAGIFYGRSNFSTNRSGKDSYLLFFTLEGCGFVHQYDQTVRIGRNQALLIDCRSPQSYGTDPETGKWIHYWVHLDGEGVKALFPLLDSANKLNVINVPRDSFIANFDVLLTNLENENTESILKDSLAMHTMLSLMAEETLIKETGTGTNRRIIQNTADYIHMHCTEPLNIDLLVKRSNLSKSYLMRLFRQYIGTTPYNYMLACRITKAKELLELTDDSMAVIAEKCGFSDSSAFSVRFQAMTSETPMHYRKTALRQRV